MTTEKSPAKAEKKSLTTDEKLAKLIEVAKANGWSLPKDLED